MRNNFTDVRTFWLLTKFHINEFKNFDHYCLTTIIDHHGHVHQYQLHTNTNHAWNLESIFFGKKKNLLNNWKHNIQISAANLFLIHFLTNKSTIWYYLILNLNVGLFFKIMLIINRAYYNQINFKPHTQPQAINFS